MSRLDDIEARIAALESALGAGLGARVLTIEEALGLVGTHTPATPVGANMQDCGRCGQTQNVNNLTCHQDKCPLK